MLNVCECMSECVCVSAQNCVHYETISLQICAGVLCMYLTLVVDRLIGLQINMSIKFILVMDSKIQKLLYLHLFADCFMKISFNPQNKSRCYLNHSYASYIQQFGGVYK